MKARAMPAATVLLALYLAVVPSAASTTPTSAASLPRRPRSFWGANTGNTATPNVTPFSRSSPATLAGAASAPYTALLNLRGGASESPPSVIGSLLASSAVPSPVKQLIVFLCKLLENLMGVQLLPPPPEETKRKKRSSGSKSRSDFSKVKQMEGGGSRKKRSGSRGTSGGGNDDAQSPKTGKSKKKRSANTPSKPKPTTKDTDEPSAATQKETEKPAAPKSPAPKAKRQRPDAASQKFLSNDLKSSNPNYRIQRELKEFIKSPPPGLSVKISGKNVRLWVVTLKMPENTVYAGDTYRLRISFPNDYPTSPPSVFFLPPTPRHEHVYTNGDICLSLLGKDWRPIMTAQSLAGSIMSILCGAQRKSLPMDNSRHAGNKPGKRQDDWVYHDDNC